MQQQQHEVGVRLTPSIKEALEGHETDGQTIYQPEATAEELRAVDEKVEGYLRRYEEHLGRERERKEQRELILEELAPKEVDLSSKLPEPKPVIARRGRVIGSEGNLSAVVGAAKSKKSFLCTAIVGDMLSLRDERENGFDKCLKRVLWIDTEQSALHVRKIARRLTALSGWNDPCKVHPFVKIYALREEAPKDRLNFLKRAIEGWLPKLVVIDGIADLQYNTNDLEESERLVTELMAISTNFNCHILCVLHTNPNTDKARGHVGSSLQRKAETVLYVHKVGECSVVEPQFCRNEPFDRFAFRIEQLIEEGLPRPAELPAEQPTGTRLQAAEVVKELYGAGVERSVLINKLIERGATTSNANVLVSRAIHRGQLLYDAATKVVRLPAAPSDQPTEVPLPLDRNREPAEEDTPF